MTASPSSDVARSSATQTKELLVKDIPLECSRSGKLIRKFPMSL